MKSRINCRLIFEPEHALKMCNIISRSEALGSACERFYSSAMNGAVFSKALFRASPFPLTPDPPHEKFEAGYMTPRINLVFSASSASSISGLTFRTPFIHRYMAAVHSRICSRGVIHEWLNKIKRRREDTAVRFSVGTPAFVRRGRRCEKLV